MSAPGGVCSRGCLLWGVSDLGVGGCLTWGVSDWGVSDLEGWLTWGSV